MGPNKVWMSLSMAQNTLSVFNTFAVGSYVSDILVLTIC